MDIYVGNINYQLGEDSLMKIFEVFGEVNKVTLLKDKYSQVSKGVAFVQMANAIQAQRAITELHGRAIGGRNLVVMVANQKYDGTKQQTLRKAEQVQEMVEEGNYYRQG